MIFPLPPPLSPCLNFSFKFFRGCCTQRERDAAVCRFYSNLDIGNLKNIIKCTLLFCDLKDGSKDGVKIVNLGGVDLAPS